MCPQRPGQAATPAPQTTGRGRRTSPARGVSAPHVLLSAGAREATMGVWSPPPAPAVLGTSTHQGASREGLKQFTRHSGRLSLPGPARWLLPLGAHAALGGTSPCPMSGPPGPDSAPSGPHPTVGLLCSTAPGTQGAVAHRFHRATLMTETESPSVNSLFCTLRSWEKATQEPARWLHASGLHSSV